MTDTRSDPAGPGPEPNFPNARISATGRRRLQAMSAPGYRRAISITLLVVSAMVVVGQQAVRDVEAGLGARLAGLLVPGVGPVAVSGTTFVLWAGTTSASAYRVAAACSVAPYVAAAGLLAAGVVWWDPQVPARCMVGRAAVVAGLLLVTNVLRITVIVACIRVLGRSAGFDVGHHDIGTVLVLAAFGTSLWLLTRPLLSRPPSAEGQR